MALFTSQTNTHLDAASKNPYGADRTLRHDSVNYFPQLPDNPEELFLSDGCSPNEFMNKYFGPDVSPGWEEIDQKNYESSEESCKEVRSVEIEHDKDQCSETSSVAVVLPRPPLKGDGGLEHVLSDHTCDCEPPKPKSLDMQAMADESSVGSKPTELSSSFSDTDISGSGDINILKSSSCEEVDTTMSENSENDIIPLDECEIDLALEKKGTVLDACGGNVLT